jgi:hypothetical protein
MGSGGALLDVDRDGDLDVLLLDSGSPPGSPLSVPPRHALLRNVSTRERGLRFEPMPAPALEGLTAMGACAGDVDGDGDDDVYVTGIPDGRLLLNDGGRLSPAKDDGGIVDPGWGTSCVFLDADHERGLDLYVAHYVRWTAAAEPECGGEIPGFRSYCPPDRYEAEPDRLFLGDGEGRFSGSRDQAFAREPGKGLGVVVADGDLYVANDQTPSELWSFDGGSAAGSGLFSGVARSEEGKAQAGMGTDAGDVDGDLDVDLVKTNFDLEGANLYVQTLSRMSRPGLGFRDAGRESGVTRATLPRLGFGVVMSDLDSDGDLDLFMANGHILPNIAALRKDQTHAMEDQLLENLGNDVDAPAHGVPRHPVPRFEDARARWAPASAEKGVGRAVLAGDLDSDGDVDLVVTRNGGPARLLRNETGPKRWIGFDLRATRSPPGAPGAKVWLRAGPWRALGLRRTGGSYLGTGDTRVLFGLGHAPEGVPVHVTVRWNVGAGASAPATGETFGPFREGAYVTLVEGSGRAPDRPRRRDHPARTIP